MGRARYRRTPGRGKRAQDPGDAARTGPRRRRTASRRRSPDRRPASTSSARAHRVGDDVDDLDPVAVDAELASRRPRPPRVARARARRARAHQALRSTRRPSASSISCGVLLAAAGRRPSVRVPRRRTPRRARRAARARPRRSCVPSITTSGCATDDLEPSRRLHRRERVGDDVVGERSTEEALGGGERDRRVVGLVRAVQRDEHVGVRRPSA